MPNQPQLNALFRPASVAFIGGMNLTPALRYHRELGFAGETWVVNPKREVIEGYDCTPTIESLPAAPDLAFVAIRRELAVEAIAALSDRGCKAVVCNAAGFAETGAAWEALFDRLGIVSATSESKLDGGMPTYDTYETADGEWMAVGALEPKFIRILAETLEWPVPTKLMASKSTWADARRGLEARFRMKSRRAWRRPSRRSMLV